MPDRRYRDVNNIIYHMHVLDLWEDPDFRDQGGMGPFKVPVYRSPASFRTGRDGTWRASVPCFPSPACDRDCIPSGI